MHEPISTTVIAVHGGLAFFGGLVHALKAHRDKTSRGWSDFAILTVMSTFTGVVFGLLAMYVSDHNMYLTMVATSIGSFWGVEGMAYAMERVLKILSK